MSWQFFTMVSVLFLSFSIILQRLLLHSHKINMYVYVVLFQLLVGLVVAVYALGIGAPQPQLDGLWGPAAICIVLFGIGHIMYARTLQLVEASLFSVLFATSAIWMMLIGVVLFDESLLTRQLIGSIVIFASILLLVKRSAWRTSWQGIWFGLVTGLLFGLAVTSWTYIGARVEEVSWTAWSFVLPPLVALLFRPRTITKIPAFVRGERSALLKMLLLAVFYAIGTVAMLYAYIYGELSIVSPLRQTGIIVTVLLAFVFIRTERTSVARKLCAAALSFVGVLLIL